MRCSGWSSLVISVSSGRRAFAAGLVLAALVLPGRAGAHVTAVSPYVYASETRQLDLQVPNEREAPMSGFVVIVPQGFRIVAASPADGWSSGADARSASWHGGSLPAGEETTFALEVEAPSQPGPATLRTQQHYPDGAVVRWDVALTVLPAPAAAPAQNLGLAVIAGLIGLLALTVVGALLWRRRTSAVH